ncbi:MAG: methionine adenosyltransferase [Planctomycetota bacterium]
MANFLFTSESVSMGHPDKVSDQISDAVLDALLAATPEADRAEVRCACETLCTTDRVVLGGELRLPDGVAFPDLEPVVRNVVREIGYLDEDVKFHADTLTFDSYLHEQSADIAMGVDAKDEKDVGAGDQGLMFGYACKETPELMPLPISLSHKVLERLNKARFGGEVDWLRPDSKSQVTVRYENDRPVAVDAVVVSTQHAAGVSQADIKTFVRDVVVKEAIPAEMLTGDVTYHINPTGQFIVGGPDGDCGLTGRKIIVDTYGGWGRHGGGAFSGKDATKVDRSAAYMARHVAKNVVAAGLAEYCEVQLAYAIGVTDPVSVRCETFGTSELPEETLTAAIREVFPLTPRAIIDHLELRRPVFRQTAAGGHFGRTGDAFTWENVQHADALKVAVA